MKLLDRYMTVQFLEVLALGTVLIAAVFFGTWEFKRIMSAMMEAGVSWQTCVMITTLQLPGTCVFCLPAGVFMATMYVLLRQGIDSEIIALRTAGVSLARVFRPFFVVGLAATVFSFALNELVVPPARKIANKMVVVAAYRSELPVGSNCLTGVQFGEHDQVKRILMVGAYLQNRLRNVVLLDLSRKEMVQITWSRLGEWHWGSWNLKDGHVYQLRSDAGEVHNSRFASMVIPGISSFKVDLAQQKFLPAQLTTVQLSERIASQRRAGKPVDRDLVLMLHQRLAQPVACLLMVLAALPLGLLGRRSRATAGFIYGGVVIAAYFLLQDICAALGVNGRLEPSAAAWLPPITLACAGGLLLFVRCRQEI